MATTKKGKAATTKTPARDRSGALYVLLEPDMLAAMDGWIERLNTGNTGPQWTRTALVRALLAKGLTDRGAKGEAP